MTLFDMSPCPSFCDLADSGVGNREATPEIRERQSITNQRPNELHLLGVKLGSVYALTTTSIGSSFRRLGPTARPAFNKHVASIVFVRAEEQVVRPDAAWHVALVTYEHAVGNRSTAKFPCEPMGAYGSAKPLRLSVTVPAYTPTPEPAIAMLDRPTPEVTFPVAAVRIPHALNKVARITAQDVFTGMANGHPGRKWSELECVCHPMGGHVHAIEPHVSRTVAILRCHPRPTGVGVANLNLVPEEMGRIHHSQDVTSSVTLVRGTAGRSSVSPHPGSLA